MRTVRCLASVALTGAVGFACAATATAAAAPTLTVLQIAGQSGATLYRADVTSASATANVSLRTSGDAYAVQVTAHCSTSCATSGDATEQSPVSTVNTGNGLALASLTLPTTARTGTWRITEVVIYDSGYPQCATQACIAATAHTYTDLSVYDSTRAFLVRKGAPTAPSRPTALVATAGARSVTVSWSSPVDDGGKPVSSYDVERSVNHFSTFRTSSTGTATTYTQTGLTNGTAYEFRVAAHNAVGTSKSSPISDPATPRPDPTTLSNSVAGTIGYGSSARVTTRVHDATTGKVLGFAPVALYTRVGDNAFERLCPKQTSEFGRAACSFKPTRNTDYKWVYTENAQHAGASSKIRTVSVAQVVQADVTHAKVRHGHPTTIYGTVTPSVAGQEVVLQRQLHGKWQASATTTTSLQSLPDGSSAVGYVFDVTKQTAGSYVFRAYCPATAKNAPGHSPSVTVTVT